MGSVTIILLDGMTIWAGTHTLSISMHGEKAQGNQAMMLIEEKIEVILKATIPTKNRKPKIARPETNVVIVVAENGELKNLLIPQAENVVTFKYLQSKFGQDTQTPGRGIQGTLGL
jgi:hypothetical protein